MRKFYSTSKALKTLNFLTLEEKRHIHEAVFTRKILSGKMPRTLTEEYTKLQPQTNTRSANKMTLNIPIHKSSKYQNSILYRTVKAWNDTSSDIRTEEAHIFKQKLQTLMTRKKYNDIA